jgi:hypothetical protein
MFKTQEALEIGMMRVFSSDRYYWRMIERDAVTPWFYLTMQIKSKGRASERSFMPDDHVLLEHLLIQQDKHAKIIDLQAMTPGLVNKQDRWLMEPLMQLELAETAQGEIVQIYTTILGAVYFYPIQSQRAINKLRNRRILYTKQPS